RRSLGGAMRIVKPSATFVLALAVASPAAQQTTAPSAPPARTSPAPPTFGSDVEMVVVDVVVVGKEGGPVAGLRREDFRVVEDGVPQEVVTFEAVDVAGTSAEPAAPEPEPKVS